MIIPLENYKNSTELRLSSSVVTILALNLNDHSITFPKNKQVVVFQFLSPQEEEELIEIGPELLALNKMKNREILNRMNQLMRLEITEEFDNQNVHRLNVTNFGSLRQKHVRIRKIYLHFRRKFLTIFLKYHNVIHYTHNLMKTIKKPSRYSLIGRTHH